MKDWWGVKLWKIAGGEGLNHGGLLGGLLKRQF